MDGKVSFFFVGAPKCGTTSLHILLGSYLYLDCGKEKEPHYFSAKELRNNSYYYDVRFIDNLLDYHDNYPKLRRDPFETRAVDFSPSYLANPNAASRIHKYNKDAKIVVIVRDPVERAISHYLMDKNLLDFEVGMRALLTEQSKLRDRYFYEYVENGLYTNHLNRFCNVFGRERVHIEVFEALFPLTERSTRGLREFLAVETDLRIDDVKSNSFDLLSVPLYRQLRRRPTLFRLFRRLPPGVKHHIKIALQRKKAVKPNMIKEREFLMDIFRKDCLDLQESFIIDLSSYWKWLGV